MNFLRYLMYIALNSWWVHVYIYIDDKLYMDRYIVYVSTTSRTNSTVYTKQLIVTNHLQFGSTA